MHAQTESSNPPNSSHPRVLRELLRTLGPRGHVRTHRFPTHRRVALEGTDPAEDHVISGDREDGAALHTQTGHAPLMT